MIAITLIATLFLAAIAILLVRGARAIQTTERHLYSELCEGTGELRAMRERETPIPECKPVRDASARNVSQEAERGIKYEFIGVMGDSES
jgi:hypothetical protein